MHLLGPTPTCLPTSIANDLVRAAPLRLNYRRVPLTARMSWPWLSRPCTSAVNRPPGIGTWFRASPRAGVATPGLSPISLSRPRSVRLVPPPPATSVNSPTAAAGGPAVPNAQLKREAADLRSAVASLEAERAEHLLRLQLLGELARRAPPTEPITVGQAADSPPADVLAAKDAEIAALRFRLREQGSRRLDSRLRLAAAFVFNPANQLDARPPPEQCASRSPPWTPAHSPPPVATSPPASPVPMARPLPYFEWGQGLARTEPGPVVAGPPACPRPVETHSPVTVSAPPPWARSNP